MKTMSLPLARLEPSLRNEVDAVLRDGETFDSFVEHAVRAQIQLRQRQAIARNRPGGSVPAHEVIRRLEARLHHARSKAAGFDPARAE